MRPLETSAVASAYDLIEDWIGVSLTGAAPQRLHDFLTRRARALGLPSATAYVDYLRKENVVGEEATALINLVTNGLTAFWRDEPQLDAVRLAIEQIGLSSTRTHPPMIWCAGCATGEEAYTLSMIAVELGVDAYVLGTDVNTDYLDAARRGVFHEWSLRRMVPWRREAHFVKLGDGRYQVSNELRRRVTFYRHNLMQPAPRAPQGAGWDIILCRNVLIYFRDDSTKQVVTNFASSMQSDGYLMLGSSEQLASYYPSGQSGPFRAARHGAGFVYRLTATPPGRTIYNFPLIREESSVAQTHWENEELSELSEETIEVSADNVVEELLDVGLSHWRSKDIESATACFEAAAAYDPFVVDTYYLIAMALITTAPMLALNTLRKVLFLEPYHWLAAYELARLQEQSGDVKRARITYRQVLEGMEARGEKPLFEIELIARELEPSEDARHDISARCEDAIILLGS